jgi:hypothetical protein
MEIPEDGESSWVKEPVPNDVPSSSSTTQAVVSATPAISKPRKIRDLFQNAI